MDDELRWSRQEVVFGMMPSYVGAGSPCLDDGDCKNETDVTCEYEISNYRSTKGSLITYYCGKNDEMVSTKDASSFEKGTQRRFTVVKQPVF
jgi:hypothetical protein